LRYAATRHNIGFRIAEELARRWDLPAPKKTFGGLLTEGRPGPGGPRVAMLMPQTFHERRRALCRAGAWRVRVPLDRVLVLHDEIDLPFGEVRFAPRGGLAGHNGLKSLKVGFGGPDFWRVRAGVGRPDSTDPDIVADYVLARFAEPAAEVDDLVARAADAAQDVLAH